MRYLISAAVFGLCGTNILSSNAAVRLPETVPRVFTQPRVSRLDQSALLTVRGVRPARQIDVRLEGSTTAIGLLASPIEVARWWVQLVRHGTVVASKPWALSATDHRDRRLHRKLVVAYSPSGDPSGRLGIFITCVRLDFGGKWRLLEATVAP